MSTALSKITTRAKAIAKARPHLKWVSAVKEASAEYRAGKLGAVAKTKKRVSGVKKVIASVPRKRMSGVKKVASTGKIMAIGRIGKASHIDKTIKHLEAKRKKAKGQLKDIIQLEINANHKKLDQLKKQYKRA